MRRFFIFRRSRATLDSLFFVRPCLVIYRWRGTVEGDESEEKIPLVSRGWRKGGLNNGKKAVTSGHDEQAREKTRSDGRRALGDGREESTEGGEEGRREGTARGLTFPTHG